MKKKIVVITEFFDPNHGGVERRVFETYKRIDKRKYDVEVYSTNFPKEKIKGVKYIKFTDYTLTSPPNRNLYRAFKFFNKAIDIIRANNNRNTIIDVNGHLAAFAASACRQNNIVITLHDIYGDEWKNMSTNFLSAWLGRIMEYSICSQGNRKFIVVNNAIGDALVRRFDQSKYDIVTVGNGIDFKSIQKIKSAKPIKGKAEFCFVGRLVPQKNIEDIISIAKDLSCQTDNFLIHVIGDGVQMSKLTKGIDMYNLGSFIKVHGSLPNKKVISIMKKCTAIIAPSKRESFGIMLLEAMACGCIPISYIHNDGPRSFISEHNGILVQNYKNIVSALTFMINKGDKVIKPYKKNCIKTAKAMDWNNITKDIEQVYTEVLK